MSKDFYELTELMLSGECTKLNTYLYYDDDTEIKIPVKEIDLANWILLNKEFLLKILKDCGSLNNEINDLSNEILYLKDEISSLENQITDLNSEILDLNEQILNLNNL